MKIWKYPVCQSEFSHTMPRGAKFLSVQLQHEDVQMWFSIDPGLRVDKLTDLRVFRVVTTGEEFGGDLEYLGTYQLGNFVYHLFEKI